MAGDVTVLRDRTTTYDDGTVVAVRLLSVPKSETYPRGIKYNFHYGTAGQPPTIRFDNHHGSHELHLGTETFRIDFPGFETLRACFRAALPPAKRAER